MIWMICMQVAYLLCAVGAYFSAKIFLKEDWDKSGKKTILYLAVCYVIGLAVFGLMYFRLGYSLMYIFRLLFVWMWISLVALIDKKKMIIPNKCVLVALIMGVLFIAIAVVTGARFQDIKTFILGMALGGGVFGLAMLLSRKGIGMGDLKLALVLGLLLGFNGIFMVMFTSLLVAAITGIVQMIVKKKDKNTMLPMAPFTMIGVLAYLVLAAEEIR